MKNRPTLAALFVFAAATAPRLLGQGGPAAEDIRGPKPPVVLPGPPPPVPWALYGAIAAGVLLVILALVWWWKRKPAPPSAERRARQELERLAREGDRLGAPEFASAASAIVRSFIERRFGLAAPRRTTEEFLQELLARPDGGLQSRVEALRTFLKACDRAKFAASDLPSTDREELVACAREVIATPVAPAVSN